MLDGVQISFLRFEPDEHFREKARKILSRIFLASPSDSVLTTVVTKISRRYLVEMTISSQSGVFHCDALGSTPEKGLRLVEQKIKRQIHQWRQSRSIDDRIPSRDPHQWIYPAS